MSETVLLGQDRQIIEIPRETWEQHLAQVPLLVRRTRKTVPREGRPG